MSSVIAIVTSTASDFPVKMAEELGVNLVDTYAHFGSETFRNRDMTMEEFHNKVEKSSKKDFPKTSQPSAQDFTETYERLKNEGYKSILSIHLSGKLSGTVNSANVAAGMLEGMDIRIIETHGASFTVTACVLRAIDLLKEGKSLDQVQEEVTKFSEGLHGYFTLKSLENMVKGGRISNIRYRFGKLLNIKPVLRVMDGEITPYAKTRGVEKAREKVYQLATEGFTKGMKFNYIIAHAALYEKAIDFEKRVKKEFPKSTGFIGEIGITVGVHTGREAIFMMCYK